MGWIGCVNCEKLWCDFVARTSSLIALVQSVLHQVSCSNKTNPKCTQTVRNKPILEFRLQWGGSGAFGAKYSDKTSFSNFCTSSTRFAPRFLWQPNGLKCTQIVRIAPKHKFMVQWGGSGAFVVKNSDATSWPNFCTSSARFAPSFVRQPNGPECTQIVQNAPKR